MIDKLPITKLETKHSSVMLDRIVHKHHDTSDRLITFAVVSDDAVHISVQMAARPHVDVWLPFSAIETQAEHAASVITLRLTHAISPLVTSEVRNDNDALCHAATFPSVSTLRLGGVDAYVSESGDCVLLHSTAGVAAGRIDLHTRHAHIDVLADVIPSRHNDVSSMLTLSVALLMNRLNRALMHAAAIAPPEGDAWLLVGDTHSGKTTTTLNLIVAGWHYLSDDHVVLSRAADDTPLVEGWPRTFHLDAGWRTGLPQHHRVDFDPRQFTTAHRSMCTKLGGVLFPVVVANEPTRLVSLTAAQALTAFIRQSPWLIVDRHAAPPTLALFTKMARLPAYQLRLGLDTFNNPTLLAERLAELTTIS